MSLRNTEVPEMMDRVASALAKAERSASPIAPIILTPEATDELGVGALRHPANLQIEFFSGSARPVVGRMIRFAKRVVRRGLRWYIAPITEQQSRFNHAMLDLVQRLRAMSDRLETQLVSSDRRQESLGASLDEQRADLERLVDRLRADLEAVAARPAPSGTADDLPPAMLPSTRERLAYRAFEDRHRGSSEEIRKLLSIYVPHFTGRRRVLDVGCGRGEFISMLGEHGVSSYGIDPDAQMVEACRERDLEVIQATAVEHLRDLAPGDIDGIISTQVIEHLSADELMEFLELAYRKLAPGGVIVLETPNPESLFIFHAFFYVDLTHTKPIHPEALRWALEATGFGDVRIERILPCPEDVALLQVPDDLIEQHGWHSLATNIVRLNALLYGPQHYAGLATKPGGTDG